MVGDSWLYDLDPKEPEYCTCDTPDPPGCPPEQQALAEETCDTLLAGMSGFAVSTHCEVTSLVVITDAL